MEKKLEEAKMKNVGQSKLGDARRPAAIPVADDDEEAGPQLPSAEMIRCPHALIVALMEKCKCKVYGEDGKFNVILHHTLKE